MHDPFLTPFLAREENSHFYLEGQYEKIDPNYHSQINVIVFSVIFRYCLDVIFGIFNFSQNVTSSGSCNPEVREHTELEF